MLFDFEQDFSGSLRCIPIAVRYKLDLCGIKLSLRQWSRFTDADRRDLLSHGSESATQIDHFRDALIALIASCAGEEAEFLPVEPAPAWADCKTVPDQIATYARSLGIAPPALAQWQSLSVLQRFTLWKLSRDSHDNVNFIPALQEFKLLDEK
jgi:hypothetical protein